jgi:hypothetical protein
METKLTSGTLPHMEIMEIQPRSQKRTDVSYKSIPAVPGLTTLWRTLPRKLWRSLLMRARGQRKTLLVRETAALGDRRFVSVIQFERQRFLIASSPSSVTLLARLPEALGAELERGDGMREGKTL